MKRILLANFGAPSPCPCPLQSPVHDDFSPSLDRFRGFLEHTLVPPPSLASLPLALLPSLPLTSLPVWIGSEVFLDKLLISYILFFRRDQLALVAFFKRSLSRSGRSPLWVFWDDRTDSSNCLPTENNTCCYHSYNIGHS